MPNFDTQDGQLPSKYVVPAKRSTYTPLQKGGCSTSLVSLESKDSFVPRWGNGFISAKKDVSDDFIQKAVNTFCQLPKPIQEFLQQSGCKIKLARTLDQIFPDLTEDTCYFKDQHWSQASGRTTDLIVGMPEYKKRPGIKGWIAYNRQEKDLYVLRHELGHVWHDITNILYNDNGTIKDEFGKAYVQDVRLLSKENCEKFEYFVRRNSQHKLEIVGMRELCADLFAALYGGGCQESEEIKAAFPRTTEYVMKESKKIIKAALSKVP